MTTVTKFKSTFDGMGLMYEAEAVMVSVKRVMNLPSMKNANNQVSMTLPSRQVPVDPQYLNSTVQLSVEVFVLHIVL